MPCRNRKKIKMRRKRKIIRFVEICQICVKLTLGSFMLVINKTIAIVVFHQKKKESMSLFATKIIKKITAMGLETAI